MKTSILTHTIAALLLAVPIARADEKKDGDKSAKTNAATSVVTSSDGTATVTIDINGKKETRTFKLGDGNNSFSFSTDGDGAAAGGVVGVGGNAQAKPGHMKKERGPWIGIAMEPVQDVVRAQLALAPGEGIVVNHVMPDSPASKAGIAENDILLRFEDQIIIEPSQFRKLIAMKKAGDTVKLTYLRKGEKKETNVTLVEHDLESGEEHGMPWLQMPQGWQGLKGGGAGNAMERMQEQFKQLKEKHPGVVVDKRSWFSGVGGAGREQFKGMLDNVRKQLDESNLSKEEKEKVRKGVEEAIDGARKAMEGAVKAGGNLRKDLEKKNDEPAKPADKKPGEPL